MRGAAGRSVPGCGDGGRAASAAADGGSTCSHSLSEAADHWYVPAPAPQPPTAAATAAVATPQPPVQPPPPPLPKVQPPTAPQPAPPSAHSEATGMGDGGYNGASLSTAMASLLSAPTQAMRELRTACVDRLQRWGVGMSEVMAAVAVLYSLTNQQLIAVYVHRLEHAELLARSVSQQDAASWLLSVLRSQVKGFQPAAAAQAGS